MLQSDEGIGFRVRIALGTTTRAPFGRFRAFKRSTALALSDCQCSAELHPRRIASLLGSWIRSKFLDSKQT